MTCGRRVNHRIRHHHRAVLVVTEGAAAMAAGAEGVIISLTLEGKRQGWRPCRVESDEQTEKGGW
jgi:hypothetical protein